jgi:hypothetical protein
MPPAAQITTQSNLRREKSTPNASRLNNGAFIIFLAGVFITFFPLGALWWRAFSKVARDGDFAAFKERLLNPSQEQTISCDPLPPAKDSATKKSTDQVNAFEGAQQMPEHEAVGALPEPRTIFSMEAAQIIAQGSQEKSPDVCDIQKPVPASVFSMETAQILQAWQALQAKYLSKTLSPTGSESDGCRESFSTEEPKSQSSGESSDDQTENPPKKAFSNQRTFDVGMRQALPRKPANPTVRMTSPHQASGMRRTTSAVSTVILPQSAPRYTQSSPRVSSPSAAGRSLQYPVLAGQRAPAPSQVQPRAGVWSVRR